MMFVVLDVDDDDDGGGGWLFLMMKMVFWGKSSSLNVDLVMVKSPSSCRGRQQGQPRCGEGVKELDQHGMRPAMFFTRACPHCCLFLGPAVPKPERKQSSGERRGKDILLPGSGREAIMLSEAEEWKERNQQKAWLSSSTVHLPMLPVLSAGIARAHAGKDGVSSAL